MTKLIESAKASGRWLHVVTYHDGVSSPIEGRLLFKRPEDAQRVAVVLLAIPAESISSVSVTPPFRFGTHPTFDTDRPEATWLRAMAVEYVRDFGGDPGPVADLLARVHAKMIFEPVVIPRSPTPT